MVFSLFEYLNQVNCNHRSTLANFSQKKRYNFWSNKDRNKKNIFH